MSTLFKNKKYVKIMIIILSWGLFCFLLGILSIWQFSCCEVYRSKRPWGLEFYSFIPIESLGYVIPPILGAFVWPFIIFLISSEIYIFSNTDRKHLISDAILCGFFTGGVGLFTAQLIGKDFLFSFFISPGLPELEYDGILDNYYPAYFFSFIFSFLLGYSIQCVQAIKTRKELGTLMLILHTTVYGFIGGLTAGMMRLLVFSSSINPGLVGIAGAYMGGIIFGIPFSVIYLFSHLKNLKYVNFFVVGLFSLWCYRHFAGFWTNTTSYWQTYVWFICVSLGILIFRRLLKSVET